jgi:hypothetical protein
MRLSLYAIVFIAILSTQPVSAAEIITKDMVVRNDAALVKALNERQNPGNIIRYMHDHISDDAKFTVTVSNPVSQINAPRNFELNKQTYINSFVQGPTFIKNYKVSIQMVDFAYDPVSGEAHSTEAMTERGMIVSLKPGEAARGGKDMESRTLCKTTYNVRKGTLQVTGGVCSTNVSLEESI